MRRSFGKERDYADEKAYAAPHRGNTRVGTTIGIDLGDIWSHYCTLNEDGEVVDRGRFRTNPSGVDKRFRDLEPVRIAMEAGTHSIWIREQIQELGHEVIVARVRELRAVSHSDRKSDKVDAEKLARYARLDPGVLRPIAHRTVAQQETLRLIRARDVLVRLRTGAVNSVRGLAKPCGVPAAGFLYTYLREALCRSAAAGSVSCAQPSAPADCGHDREDQAIRRAIQQPDQDRISRDAGSHQGLRSRSPHGAYLRSDPGQQAALSAKSRCRLLSRPAAEAQPVRRQRATARDCQGRQRVSATVAGRVRQPCDRASRKGLCLAEVGFQPWCTRWKSCVKTG
jgi:transposase